MTKTIALVGDYSKEVGSHRAIPMALELAGKSLDIAVHWSWVETTAISNHYTEELAEFSAIWLVPGSPYQNMQGAIDTARFARETRRPFLGTCGGFQHALIEIARDVCGATEADHAETNPNGRELVITPLECSLVEKIDQVFFKPGSRLYALFDGQPTTENYFCRYGLNPDWKNRLESAGVVFSGYDSAGEPRAFELRSHPFFIGTLFQPERLALRHQSHPLIEAFVKAS